MNKPLPANRYIVFLLLIFGELWGQHGPDGRTIWVLPDYFGFELSLNQGALFGLGQGLVWLFASLSLIAAVGILIWLFWMNAAQYWWLNIALALIFGGILGNLYDRLGLHQLMWPEHLAAVYGEEPGSRIYAVRDWILLTYRGHKWPNFNIADSLLVCGAAMLFVHSVSGYPQSSGSQSSKSSPDNGSQANKSA